MRPQIYHQHVAPEDNITNLQAAICRMSRSGAEICSYLLHIVTEAFHSVPHTPNVSGAVVQQIDIF